MDKCFKLIAQFAKDTAGATLTIWALALSSVLITAGAAYDINIANAADVKAQNIADNAALRAAIYMNSNSQTPQSDSDGFVGDKEYSLQTAGYSLAPYTAVENGTEQAFITVKYNTADQTVTATVTGKTRPAFVSLFGVAAINFSADSVVTYSPEDLNNSLSVAVVLDTSGSMYYYDETGTKREDAMEQAVIELMNDLDAIVSGQETNGRILRTGMLPYYSQIWWSRVENMGWGTIAASDINALYEGGGTNSASPMEKAVEWMAAENAYHEAETGRTDPKKYVILMTDGVNNYTSYDSRTITACDQMKAAGTEIYTIGYALTSQTYSSPNGNTYTPTSAEITRANTLLSGCASSPDHFKKTSSTTNIDEIFENIGAAIVAEALRISM